MYLETTTKYSATYLYIVRIYTSIPRTRQARVCLLEERPIILILFLFTFDEFTFSLANYLVRDGTILCRGVSRLVACSQITSYGIRRPWSARAAHILHRVTCAYTLVVN